MATTSRTTKTKQENQNLNRSRSLGRKPKQVPSSEPDANGDGSDRKTIEKPLPNYLKPTISSRPDPVKFLKKNNALEDNHKLLRRRSFDHPSSSSSSPKSLNISPRDKPAVPREKPVTGLRSASLHGSSRSGLRGSSAVKSPSVATRGSPSAKKSGMSGSSSSKSKREGSKNVLKKSSGKEITPESSPLAPTHEDEEEIVKVETNAQVSGLKEEAKSGEENETGPVDASTEEEKGELVNEEKPKEQLEEPVDQENNTEDEAKVEKKVDDEEKSETDAKEMKETANVGKSMEEGEEESESSKVKEETTETKSQVEELAEEGTKKEVVQGKKESPAAYNDVIASKLQENSKKNKVLALAGAFQTVIDYETAASK